MEDVWTCYLCGVQLSGKARISRHKANLWLVSTDASRCDNLARSTNIEPQEAEGVVITRPITLWELARREPVSWEAERRTRAAYTIRAFEFDPTHILRCRDMTPVQDAWDEHLAACKNLCSDDFWRIFLPIHRSPRVHIDSTLTSVKKVFLQGGNREALKKFPMDMRQLRKKMSGLTPFWSQVLHSHHIDLAEFANDLPSGTKHITFRFVDPVWGWLMAARQQHPQELHWRPAAQPCGQKVYGGGIQFGEFFRHACSTIPAGSSPMCVGLHWDGTSARAVSSAPICVCVGNSNSCDKSTQFCVGYMPHIPDSKRPEWRKLACATKLKFYVRQQCAAAILRVLEEAAKRGVICRLINQENEEITRLLFPRLSSMNFDQPEAQLFYGMQNKCSCSKCRRRKGYSAFKRCRPHRGEDVGTLLRLANDETCPDKQLYREKLHRWGFNYKRRCCLVTTCDALLVRLPGTDEVFPCVDYRDRMHGLLMFLHRVMFTALSELVTKQKHRRILDRRLNAVCARKFVYEGVSLRRQRSIFTDVGMSATDKVTVLMLLPHVVGPVPDTIFPPRIHVPLATAVARAQLMVLAVRGRRSYTKTELELIFDDGFVVLFGALETLNVERFNVAVRTYNKKLRAGKKTGKKPTPFKKQSRYSGSTISRAGDQSVVSKIKYIVYTENARKFTVLTMNFITICA